MNNHHKEIIKQYIEKYGETKGADENYELYRILSNPKNEKSGEFFELYNQKEIAKIIEESALYLKYVEKIANLFSALYNQKIQDIKDMAKGTLSCTFANMSDISYRLRDHSDQWDSISSHVVSTQLQCTDENILQGFFEVGNDNEGIERILSDWSNYNGLTTYFEKVTRPFTNEIINHPILIEIIKKDILEEKIVELQNRLLGIFEEDCYIGVRVKPETVIENISHSIEKIRHLEANGLYDEIEQERRRFGTKRIAIILEIIHLEEKLHITHETIEAHIRPLQDDINCLDLADIIVLHFKKDHEEKRISIKKSFLNIQETEIMLRSRLRGYIPL